MDVDCVSTGLLPSVGLHHRDGAFYHESSYSKIWLAGITIATGVGVLLLWKGAPTPLGNVRCWIFGAFVLSAASMVAAVNLAWRDGDGTIGRHCLLEHRVKAFVTRLGRRYEASLGWPLVDHTACDA